MSDSYGNSFVSIACTNHDVVTLHKLIKGGFDVQSLDRYGNSSLSIAIDSNDISTVNLLLSSGASLAERDRYGNSCSSLLVKKVALAYTVFQSTDVPTQNWNGQDRYGSSTLAIVVKSGDLELVRKLMLTGIDLNSTDRYGKKCVEIALQLGFNSIVDMLVENGAQAPTTEENKHERKSNRDINIIQSMKSTNNCSKLNMNGVEIQGFGLSDCSMETDRVILDDIMIDLVPQKRMTNSDFHVSFQKSNGNFFAILEAKNKIICTPGTKIDISDGFITVDGKNFINFICNDLTINVKLNANDDCMLIKNNAVMRLHGSSIRYQNSTFYIDSCALVF